MVPLSLATPVGKRKDLVEVIAFHPILEFAGAVTRVGAGFEHGHDDDFDWDRWGFGQAGGRCGKGA